MPLNARLPASVSNRKNNYHVISDDIGNYEREVLDFSVAQ